MQLVRLPATTAPVVLNNAAASFPQPVAAGGGGDISVWRGPEGFGPADVNISLQASGATVIPAGLGVFGEKDNGEVGFIGLLNNGQAIVIASAAVGFDEPVAGAGIFKRLLIGGVSGTVTPAPAANVTAKALPIWTKRSEP